MLRRFVSLLIALFALTLGAARASAQPQDMRLPNEAVPAKPLAPHELPPATHERGMSAPDAPALGRDTTPGDAPRIADVSRVVIPRAPADWLEKDLGWAHVVFPPGALARVEPLLRSADEMRAKLTSDLGQRVLDNVEVRIAHTPEEMAELAPVDMPPPAYASGVAYPGIHLVLLTMQAPSSAEAVDLDEVFRHELSHVALEDAVAGRHVPRWFNEGLAVYESGESAMLRAQTLWNATLSKTLLPLAELDRGFPSDRFEVNIAYAESADFVRFLLRDDDRIRFGSLIDRIRGGEPFDRALSDAYGTDVRKLEYEWKEELSRRYSLLPVLTGGSILWFGIVALMIVGYLRRRRAAKAKLAEWEIEERAAEARAAAARARAALLEEAEHRDDVIVRPSGSSPPMIEHDGRWHTLH